MAFVRPHCTPYVAWLPKMLACTIRLVGDRQLGRLQKRVGVAIRQHRDRLGLTQEEAAHRMGLVPRHLQKIEAGTVNVTLRTLLRIATAYLVDITDLF